MTDYDICILGAGIAGMYCAREIAKAWPDAKIVIVEKYKYIGGRATTFKKLIPGVGHVQWENGAGRLHKSHKRLLRLCAEYNLDILPIPPGIEFRSETFGDSQPTDFGKMLQVFAPLRSVKNETIRMYTLQSALNRVIGKAKTSELLDRYEYRSELDTLRADKGLDALDHELGEQTGFYVMKDGFSSLVKSLREDIEARGVTILRDFTVEDIKSSGVGYDILLKKRPNLKSRNVIVALHRDAVAELPCFRGHPLLKQVKMRPLVRMYAVFPKQTGNTVWFADLIKFVCPPPVRYVIPIDPTRGIIMISYTDGPEAEYWLTKMKRDGEKAVQREVLSEIRNLFPNRIIPDPLFFKIHPWYDGCSYWTPGSYDVEKQSQAAIHPLPHMPGVWMCGESWNVDQCWIESAVEHADHMLDGFLKK